MNLDQKIPFKDYLKQKVEWFDSYLTSSFPPLHPQIETLRESMQYSLFAGGKRLRPILLLETVECCGENPEKALPFAASLEYIHTYSLIHDDLPCMDDDALRRGKPTNHIRFGEAIALLAGDALLTYAFQIISDPKRLEHFSSEQLLASLFALSKGAGAHGMVGGQMADIHRVGNFPPEERLDYIHSYKTGALITASIEMGAILAGVEEKQRKLLIDFGVAIGKSFQIQDDILDETASTEELGKPAGSDQKNEKLTYPMVYGLEKSKELAKETYFQAISSLDSLPFPVDRLKEIAQFIINRGH